MLSVLHAAEFQSPNSMERSEASCLESLTMQIGVKRLDVYKEQ